MSLRSAEGWASKSKSEICQGAGRQANRARLACAGLGSGDLPGEQPFQERGMAELAGPGVVELGGQRLGGRGHPQRGEVAAQPLVDLVVAHRPASASSA